ncbi:MAG TPA: hypothetical protein VLH39_08800 [Magnetospirillaceae bacterium]|nr:hypothetical protein [Magnetospirillaceae bacterium]
MKQKQRLIAALIILVTLTAGGKVFGQGQFRTITSLGFSYYTDQRYGIDWENVLIAPLTAGFYLVAAATGENTSFSDQTGGRLGLAFDLPGAYYGEGAYALNYDWRESSFLHTVYLSASYESAPALASLSFTGEFTETSAGGILSPALRYTLSPELTLSTTLFVAFHHYDPDEQYFNVAVLGRGEYALAPGILISLGGTFSTVYEPTNQHEKWSILGGITVKPSALISLKSQLEYANAMRAETDPHEIVSIHLVVDVRFRAGK